MEFESNVFLMDCMEGMRNTPDGFYDLAVVDPEYGIGFSDYEIDADYYHAQEKRFKNYLSQLTLDFKRA